MMLIDIKLEKIRKEQKQIKGKMDFFTRLKLLDEVKVCESENYNDFILKASDFDNEFIEKELKRLNDRRKYIESKLLEAINKLIEIEKKS